MKTFTALCVALHEEIWTHLAARAAFLFSDDAGMLNRSALFCNFCVGKGNMDLKLDHNHFRINTKT